jgi:hypothetical protein
LFISLGFKYDQVETRPDGQADTVGRQTRWAGRHGGQADTVGNVGKMGIVEKVGEAGKAGYDDKVGKVGMANTESKAGRVSKKVLQAR